jgi:hypothetical protein
MADPRIPNEGGVGEKSRTSAISTFRHSFAPRSKNLLPIGHSEIWRRPLEKFGRPMTETVRDMAGMVEVFRARIRELDLTFATVDGLAGLPDGYCSKLMCGMKKLGPITVQALCGALALGFVPVVDEEQAAKVQGRWESRKRPVFPTRATDRPALPPPASVTSHGALLASSTAPMLVTTEEPTDGNKTAD